MNYAELGITSCSLYLHIFFGHW